jgi:hypothetical protein
MGMQDYLKKISQLDFKGGVSIWNDVLFLVKNNRFKITTTIIISSILAPLVEDYGAINSKRV